MDELLSLPFAAFATFQLNLSKSEAFATMWQCNSAALRIWRRCVSILAKQRNTGAQVLDQ